MGYLKQNLLKSKNWLDYGKKPKGSCQFEDCKNNAEISIIDGETLQEVKICKECNEKIEEK
jgi:hypothetical protein